jgi:hypothetical protein
MRHVKNMKYYVGCRVFKTYSTAEYYAREVLKLSGAWMKVLGRQVVASK